MGDTVYSYHTYILPFSWIASGKYYEKFVNYFEKNSFWECTDIEDSDDINISARSILGEDEACLYQEYQYFTPYARKAIYGLDEKIVRNYSFMSHEIHNKASYNIVKGNLRYALNLNAIRLKIYNTGVALFILECENNQYRNIEDVKNINDYGRRITLPFVPDNPDWSITADSLEIRLANGDSFRTDFKSYIEDKKSGISMNYTAGFIKDILNYGGMSQKTFSSHKLEKSDIFRITPLLGDRMFVQSLISDPAAVEKTSDKNSLYEVVFVDHSGGCSCANDELRDELLKGSFYKRWEGLGHLYYITNYSFIFITKGDFQPTVTSFITQYYQMFCLAVAQRASITGFKRDIAWISSLFRREMSEAEERKCLDKITEMTEKYIAFESQLYFDEVSPEQQGIEIYDMIKKEFRLEEEIASLREQVDSLYNVANIRSSNKSNNIMSALTWVAFFVSIGSMVISALQLVGIDDTNIPGCLKGLGLDTVGIFVLAVITILAMLIFFAILFIDVKRRNRSNR